MKITKKQLKQLLNEAITGGVGIGFVGWSNNKRPDFAKSYGKDARYARDILKDKLRVIVQEEVEVNSYKEEKVDQEVVDGASLAASHPSEIQTSPNFSGGANLVHSIDYSKAAGVESNTKGQEVLKITEGQLRRIIEEEKTKLISEIGYRHPKTGEDLLLMLNDVVDKLLDQGMDTMELAGELRGLADDVEDSTPADDFMDVEGFRSEMARRSR